MTYRWLLKSPFLHEYKDNHFNFIEHSFMNTQISKWKSESRPAYILELIMQMAGIIVVLHFGVIHSAGGAEGNKWWINKGHYTAQQKQQQWKFYLFPISSGTNNRLADCCFVLD